MVEFGSDVSCSSDCWGGVDAVVLVPVAVETGWVGFAALVPVVSVEMFAAGMFAVPVAVGMFEGVPVAVLLEPGWVGGDSGLAVMFAVVLGCWLVGIVAVPVAALVEPGLF